ncbi:MAG: hypothetical protein CVT68_11210, partial [Actinobacteria bacterium HGW-Actinobacteria-8]
MPTFVPALSQSEAEARLSAIAGGTVEKSRGPKRTLRMFANDLGVNVPISATNGRLGGAVADALSVRWPDDAYTDSDQVTLAGLNALLEGAMRYYATHTPPTSNALPAQFATRDWSWFRPSRSKIEAVNRIADLTNSGPEFLGPGGKERKSVFENLVSRGGINISRSLTKTDLGAALAAEFDVVWTPTCGSTGETITLEGLNVVLAGAERRWHSRGIVPQTDPIAEAKMLLNILRSEFSDGPWDGRAAVEEMRDDGCSQWRQMEWPGFYYEYRGLRALYNGMERRTWSHPAQKYGVTVFDYAHHYVWDMKAHTESVRAEVSGETVRGRSTAPLNDHHSTDLCAADTGVGLLVLNGEALVDETKAFDLWHRAVTKDGRARVDQRIAAATFSRARKKAFTPLTISAYRWNDMNDVLAARSAGALAFMYQGRQASGAARPAKYALKPNRADDWLVAEASLVDS